MNNEQNITVIDLMYEANIGALSDIVSGLIDVNYLIFTERDYQEPDHDIIVRIRNSNIEQLLIDGVFVLTNNGYNIVENINILDAMKVHEEEYQQIIILTVDKHAPIKRKYEISRLVCSGFLERLSDAVAYSIERIEDDLYTEFDYIAEVTKGANIELPLPALHASRAYALSSIILSNILKDVVVARVFMMVADSDNNEFTDTLLKALGFLTLHVIVETIVSRPIPHLDKDRVMDLVFGNVVNRHNYKEMSNYISNVLVEGNHSSGGVITGTNINIPVRKSIDGVIIDEILNSRAEHAVYADNPYNNRYTKENIDDMLNRLYEYYK